MLIVFEKKKKKTLKTVTTTTKTKTAAIDRSIEADDADLIAAVSSIKCWC